MATFTDKQLVATRWYGRPSLGELFVSPTGDDASIQTMAKAIRAARLVVAGRTATFMFIILAVFAFATLGKYGLLAFTGVAIFGIMWFASNRHYKELTSTLKVGDLRAGDVDDTIGFSRLNVALDDAVRAEADGTISDEARAEISAVLSQLPDRFDYQDAERASVHVWEALQAAPATG